MAKKVYTKIHTNLRIANLHAKKIRARGGKVKIEHYPAAGKRGETKLIYSF